MLDNPLSQIERTKDAYAGDMQGLQKRANMTKELVDLLAMQQLKQDLDAVKRNQMMQQQGNPETIKDQMQQGLMGEYRQQAAKEMGVGPSEMDVVQRARQGMPQGMPQGAPQQPRMAQGMMSQARPVQLAGGGIVSFNEGGRSFIAELGSDIANYVKENPAEAALVGLSLVPGVGVVGAAGLRAGLAGLKALKGIDYATKGKKALDVASRAITRPDPGKFRQSTRAFDPKLDRSISPNRAAALSAAGGLGTLAIGGEDEEEIASQGDPTATSNIIEQQLTPPEDTPGSGIMIQGIPQTDPNSVAAAGAADSADGKEAPLTGLDAITQKQIELFTTDMPKFEPPQASQRLRDAIGEGIMSLDEARAESTKREDRALELMGMGPDGQSRRDFEEQLTGLAALRDRNAETQRRRDLIEFLGAGFSKGAETYVAQEDARRARDAEYLTDRRTIQNTRAELQKVAGQEAVDSYDNALSSYLTTRSNAVRDLSNLEGQDREDYRTSYKAGLDNRQMQADILSSLSATERSALDRAISGRNADANILQVAFAGLDKQQAAIESAKLTEIQRIVGPEIAQKVALNGALSDEEKAAYVAAQIQVSKDFAEEEAALATLRADALKKVSQSVTGEEISPNSAGGAAITAYSS